MRSRPRRLAAAALAAAVALCGAGCSRSPESWLADLESVDPLDRRLAAAWLASADRSVQERAVLPLMDVFLDADPLARAQAKLTLAVIARADVAPFLRVLGPMPADLPRARIGATHARRYATYFVPAAGARAVPPLLALLEDPSTPDRRLVAETLGRIGVPSIPALRRFAASAAPEDEPLIEAAVDAFLVAGGGKAEPLLAGGEDPGTVRVRDVARRKIDAMYPADGKAMAAMAADVAKMPIERFVVALPPLLDAISRAIVHGPDSERETARQALAVLGARGTSALVARASSAIPELRDLAWRAIEGAPLDVRVKVLRQLDAARSNHVPLLLRLAGRFEAEAVPALSEMLNESDPGSQMKAAAALSALGPAAASTRARLQELTHSSDPLVSVAASRALEHIP